LVTSATIVGKDAARTVRAGLCLAIRFLEEVTTMSSKKVEPAPQPVCSTTLRYHLKPRPIEADLKEKRKDRRSQARCRRGFRVGGGAATDPGARPAVQAKAEPIAGWITRAEARSVLGIEEKELAELLTRFRLRKSSVEVYSKAEILALREIVAKLR
jgi:hypothetical protein